MTADNQGPDGVRAALDSWFEAREWMQVETFRDGKLTRIQLFTDREPALEAAGLTNQEEMR